MDKKIRVAAVSYLNSKPLTYGLENGLLKDKIELVFDYPAKVSALLLNDEAAIGLIPVAEIPKLKEHHIVSGYGIGATGPVASVCLFSDVPVTEIKEILLDYQSRTSVALLKILLKEFWHINPVLCSTEEGYQDKIKGTTAGLIIGDRALLQRDHSAYVYDLAEAWQQMTGLPFLFAAWVANCKLPQPFIDEFDNAIASGFDHLPGIIAANPFPGYDLHTYFTQNISYRLTTDMKKGMELFLQKIGNS